MAPVKVATGEMCQNRILFKQFIMRGAIDQPRAELSKYAPRIETIKINPDKIGALIGPGGTRIVAVDIRYSTWERAVLTLSSASASSLSMSASRLVSTPCITLSNAA